MNDQTDDELRQRIADLEQEVAALRSGAPPRIRKRSEAEFFCVPLLEIATGPDPERGEPRGHAKAIFAVGDIATGLFALGGIARGGICIGGVSVGLVTLGGVSMSLLFAMGGVAIAPLAFGGAAIGVVAVGGAAIGYYAKGGAAFGAHAISALRQDPEAVTFFAKWLPWLK
jgi:hypothetical protein